MSAAPVIAIREAGAGDAALLSLVAGASFLEAFGEMIPADDILAHCTDALGTEAFARSLAKPRTRAWLAGVGEGQAPIGYALIHEPDLPVPIESGDLELKRIYLLSRWHGSGIAGELMARSIAAARELAAPRLLIGVYDGNERAIGFYKKTGFDVVGERNFIVGSQTYHDLIFARRL